MSKSKQALIYRVLPILFFFIIAILSEYFGKHYLAKMEFEAIRKQDPITKQVIDNSLSPQTNPRTRYKSKNH